jgi:hypothetical protein
MRAAAILTIVLSLSASSALAAPPATRAEATASFERAELASRERRFAEALAAYREATVIDPSAPFAPVARARAADLEAHAEGGFAPLARLEELRRDPARSRDRAAIEALERDAEGFPEGRVRSEARLLVAEAWSHRLGDPGRALAPLGAVIADPSADRLTRALALAELCGIHRARGELAEALAAVERDPGLSPALRAEIVRAVRREKLRWIALGVLGALAVVGAGSLALLARRSRDVRDLPGQVVRPLSVASSLYLGGAGAILVKLHGGGDARPFVLFGAGVLALDVIARAFLLAWGRTTAALRAGWALCCVAGVVAAAFLAALRVDPSYLEGLGL